jgi:hypothetical protein
LKEAATNTFVSVLASATKGEAWSRIKDFDELLVELMKKNSPPNNMGKGSIETK